MIITIDVDSNLMKPKTNLKEERCKWALALLQLKYIIKAHPLNMWH